jgi:hypothetical protein
VEFFKDDVQLKAVELPPQQSLTLTTKMPLKERAVANLYNRLGGLLDQVGRQAGLEAEKALAVWLVESSGISFMQKRAVIRLEVHQLYDAWGKRNRTAFESHFRFGGHGQQPGNPWENQEYRTQGTGLFSSVHHNQTAEYAALTLARLVAGDEVALSCTSIGGCQVMMGYHKMLGYEKVTDMYNAFQSSEAAHVLGFFDYCRAKAAPKVGDLIKYLQAKDWPSFGKYYNGLGRVQAYADALQSNYEIACLLLAKPKAA